MYRNNGNLWVTDGQIRNYGEGSTFEWIIEQKESSHEEPVLELFNVADSNTEPYIWLHARQLKDEDGWVSYKITAKLNGEVIEERELKIDLYGQPDNLPTRLWADPQEYWVGVNEEIFIGYDNFGLANGEIPEGAAIRKEIWTGDLTNDNYHEWHEDGLHVWVDHDAVYNITLAIGFNNYTLTRDVRIVVGTTPFITTFQPYETIYSNVNEDCEDKWVAQLYLDNFVPYEGMQIEWNCEPVLAEGEKPIFNLYVDESRTWDDGRGVHIYYDELTGEGESRWIISATVNGETYSTEELVFNVVGLPENLPTMLDLPNEIHIGLHERYYFERYCINPGDGVIPENSEVSQDFWVDGELEKLDGFVWGENCDYFELVSGIDGKYFIDASLRIGNYRIYHRIWLYVGEPLYTEWYDNGDTLYAMAGTSHGIGAAYLQNYNPSYGQIHWGLEVLEGDNLCEVVIPEGGATWDDGRGLNLNFNNFTGEIGTLRYVLRVFTDSGFEEEHEYTYQVMEKPEGLPTELVNVEPVYYLKPGDSINFNIDEIGFGEGEVPENYWNYWFVDTNGINHEWYDNNITMYFNDPGRYWFTVNKHINNYMVTQYVTVEVEGYVDVQQAFDTLYAGVTGADQYACWGGKIALYSFKLMPDEEITWDIYKSSGDENVTAMLELTADDPFYANLECYNVGNETGSVVYTVTAESNKGYHYYYEFAFRVVDKPEDLPEELRVGTTEYVVPAGSEFLIHYSDFTVDYMPENAYFKIERTHELPFENYSFEDEEYGKVLYLNPTEEGEYTVTAQFCCGNYTLSQNITIRVVGSVQWRQAIDKVFVGIEETEPYWVGVAMLTGYTRADDETITWSNERTSGYEDLTLDFVIDGETDNQPLVHFYCSNIGNNKGEVTYTVTMHSTKGFSVSRDFNISIEDLPEGVPTELYVQNERYEIAVGDAENIYYRDFGLDADLPEGAYFFIDGANDLPANRYFDVDSDGTEYLHINPQSVGEGEYTLSAQMIYGNYIIETPITIVITE